MTAGRPETVDIAARLLSTAMAEVVPEGTQPPDYLRFIAPDWREAPATRAGHRGPHGGRGADRRAGSSSNGCGLEWRPGAPVPAPTGRLSFRPVTGPA